MSRINGHGVYDQIGLIGSPAGGLDDLSFNQVNILTIGDQFHVLRCSVCNEDKGILDDHGIVDAKRIDGDFNKNKKAVFGRNLNIVENTSGFTVEVHPVKRTFSSSKIHGGNLHRLAVGIIHLKAKGSGSDGRKYRVERNRIGRKAKNSPGFCIKILFHAFPA